MIGDWRKQADAIIAEVDRNLPLGADLQTRRQACLRAKPWEFHVTSWGRKVWGKAQRAYLERHGLAPLHPALPPQLPESPLERAKRKAGAA
jgi:hypothetical protein